MPCCPNSWKTTCTPLSSPSAHLATPEPFALLQVANATVEHKSSPLLPQPTLQQRVGGHCRQWLPLRHSEEKRMRFAVVPIIQTAALTALHTPRCTERAGVKYHCCVGPLQPHADHTLLASGEFLSTCKVLRPIPAPNAFVIRRTNCLQCGAEPSN